MTNRERATLERILIDMRADADYGNVRMRHYVQTLEAFLGLDYKFLRNHNYRLTPSQEAAQSNA